METKSLLKALTKLMADLAAIISELESISPQDKLVRLSLLRQMFILTSIYEAGQEVTTNEISNIARSIGRTPGSVSGFYAGNDPLMIRSNTNDKLRKLTKRSEDLVVEYKNLWGADWISNLKADTIFSRVSDPQTSEKILIQIP